MNSSLFVAAPLKPFFLHVPQNSQNSLLRSRSPSFLPKSSAPPSRIAAASVFSSPSSHGRLVAQPYFTSSTSFDPYYPVSSAPHTPPTAKKGAESDITGRRLRPRLVFLFGSIDDFVADTIISQLATLDDEDHTKDIKLYINSSGGSLSAAIAIYDMIQTVRADVSTIAHGFVASTASIILGGGTRGKRLSTPNSAIMIHQRMGGASDQATDVEIQAREIMHNKEMITRLIASFTGRTVEQVKIDIDLYRYMSSFEAIEYGIVDGVIEKGSIISLEPGKPKLDYEELHKGYEELYKDLLSGLPYPSW